MPSYCLRLITFWQYYHLINNQTELLNVSTIGAINWNTQNTNGSQHWEKPSYDASGNITGMQRASAAAFTQIDNLAYNYDQGLPTRQAGGASGNKINIKLLHVKDNGIATQGAPDQGNYNPANPNYGYDAKGRMIQDQVDDIGTKGIL